MPPTPWVGLELFLIVFLEHPARIWDCSCVQRNMEIGTAGDDLALPNNAPQASDRTNLGLGLEAILHVC